MNQLFLFDSKKQQPEVGKGGGVHWSAHPL